MLIVSGVQHSFISSKNMLKMRLSGKQIRGRLLCSISTFVREGNLKCRGMKTHVMYMEMGLMHFSFSSVVHAHFCLTHFTFYASTFHSLPSLNFTSFPLHILFCHKRHVHCRLVENMKYLILITAVSEHCLKLIL